MDEQLRIILIIIVSVSIFGLLVFVFVKNYIRNKINQLVNEKKDNHFIDTQNLYTASIDTYINNVVIDTNIDIYKIRNSTDVTTVKSTTPWYVFGNKYNITNITLSGFSKTKFSYIVNDDFYNVKISESINSVNWDLNLTRFFSGFANNNR